MKLSPPNSASTCKASRARYVVCGDEHLLCQEACDAIRALPRTGVQ